MAKDLTEKKLKKEKKEKKEKRSETDGVSKSSKKDKKEKKMQVDAEMVDALEAELQKAPEEKLVQAAEGEDDEPKGALVPFAFPLADQEKEVKKILKTVKKCRFPLCPKITHILSLRFHPKQRTSTLPTRRS